MKLGNRQICKACKESNKQITQWYGGEVEN